MEQQQIKVSFSVGMKLLLSAVTLLFVVILFLSVSSILLVVEDKRAYTYQAQSVEAVMAGREFVNTSRHASDTLRLMLSSINPRMPVTPQQQATLESAINNQSEVAGASLVLLDRATGSVTRITDVSRLKETLTDPSMNPADVRISPEDLKPHLVEIATKGYALINLTQASTSPWLGVVFADLKSQGAASGIPAAIGLVSLKGFGKDIRNSTITIATRDGSLLFDSDAATLASTRSVHENPLFQKANGTQLASGATEFELAGVRYLGSYTRPGLDLIVFSKTGWRKAMKATFALTEKSILLGLMAIGAAIVFALIFAKRLTAPLNRLYLATKSVADGNFAVDLGEESKGRDEIAALSQSFTVMSKKISELIDGKIAAFRIENEIAIASTVQQTLIPPTIFKTDRVLIHSHYQSASECGGDWWGFFGIDRKICVMIGDATGHGLPSALITASARSCFSVMAKLAQEDPDFTYSPSAMLSYANRVIHDAASGQIMMTFFVGVIDFDRMTITFSSAGHNPPWLFRKDKTLKSLVATGMRLGEKRDTTDFEEISVPISEDDILLLYTDGLMEGKNQSGEMYGKKRARKVVEAALETGPNGVIIALTADFMAHNGTKPLDDDLTLACAHIKKFSEAAQAHVEA